MKIKPSKNINITYTKASEKNRIAIINLLKNLNGDSANFNIDKFYVAKENDELIGCIRIKVYENGCLELASLAVRKEYQHRGIGSELVKILLLNEPSRPIFLLTSSDKEMFYKKFNFDITNPLELPNDFKKEYERIISLPFSKELKVIAMVIK
jgi:N-acetylglutamate synthase-like GNAT family acetyltransferase